MYVRTLHHSLIDEEQLHRHVREVGLLGGVWGLPTDMLHCAWNLWNRSIASLLNNLDMSQTGRKIKRYSSTTLRRSCFRKPWLFLLASLPCLWIITTWTSVVLNYVDRYKIQWFEGTIETESIFGYLPLPQGQHSIITPLDIPTTIKRAAWRLIKSKLLKQILGRLLAAKVFRVEKLAILLVVGI